VPCKFFRVGSCTAGPSCPFSHHLQEPGQHKDVCTWFVKGNCKFGHKCALAHILPGQTMSMDRKNKKAAQIAAGGASNGNPKETNKAGKAQKRDASASTSSGGPNRNPLLSGSTAPTRNLAASARPPMTMPLKASISPSAPAPPLMDTDFASLGLMDEHEKTPTAPAQRKPVTPPPVVEVFAPPEAIPAPTPAPALSPQDIPHPKSPPSPLPLSTPRRAAVQKHRASNSIDFGPIGSPPRASPAQPSRLNGGSPETSPSQVAFTSTSPFSAPGTHSVFLTYDNLDGPSNFKSRSGLAASLGATRHWNAEFVAIPHQVSKGPDAGALGSMALGGQIAVEDDDLEEFIPGSLTDLLTPEERSRRISRTTTTHSQSSAVIMTVREPSANGQRTHGEGSHHRYSRSVPAQSLLGDIRSLWAVGEEIPGSPPSTMVNSGHAGLGLNPNFAGGTAGSFKSSSALGGRSFGEDMHSPSLFTPSNASAAFLPTFHQHYLSAKMGTGNARTGAMSLHPNAESGTNANSNAIPSFVHTSSQNAALSPPRINAFGSRPPFEAPESTLTSGTYGRPIPSGGNGFVADGEDRRNALSPSTRALQAHAPGQSLPQGLAAGYSRIHALPPIPSPNASMGFSQGQLTQPTSTNGPDWSMNGAQENGLGMNQGGGNARAAAAAAADGLLSRLSYSAAASKGSSTLSAAQPYSVVSAAGMGRIPSAGKWQTQGGGPLSPLSRPVHTADPDDLFSMDG
jgi:hypothetical protein